MKTKQNFQPVFFNLLALVFLLSVSFELLAQETETSELKEFKITVEQTDDGVELQCVVGCAWKELSFSTIGEEPQAIDEYGMTDLNENSPLKDTDLADFLFTLTKTEKGISLQGVEGTAWKDLSFWSSINKTQDIDQHGMTDFN